MVGLAFEVHDTFRNIESAKNSKEEDEKLKLKMEYQNIAPTVYDIWSYAYCYIGIGTGDLL